MNIERFHAIARAILEDLRSFDFQVKVAELVQHLRKRISEPGNPAVGQALDQALLELRDRLPKLGSNTFSPTWLQHMREHALDLFIGSELLDKVEAVLRENSLTPSVAEKELGGISQSLSEQVQALRNFVGAMDRFKVPVEDVPSGQAELGVLIPRMAVKNDVHTFGKELVRLSKLVGVFQEISTGSRAELKIDSVSSSDLSIFFMIDPVTAKLWLDVLNGLLDTFRNIVEIRKSIQELRKKGVPDDAVAGLEDHANGQIKVKIKETVDEILNNDGIATKRKSELAIEFEGALNQIAVKLDNGFNFEVRAKPFEKDPQPDRADQQAALKAVQAGSAKLQFLKMDGQPILRLAAPSADSESPSEEAETKARRSSRKGKKKSDDGPSA